MILQKAVGLVRLTGAVAAFCLCVALPVSAAEPKAAAAENVVVNVPPIFPGVVTKPVIFSRLGTTLQIGQDIGKIRMAMFTERVPFQAQAFREMQAYLTTVFSNEVALAGFNETGSADLFPSEGAAVAEYEIAASLQSAEWDLSGGLIGFRGTVAAGFEWQIYSHKERKIVARIPTDGVFALRKDVASWEQQLAVGVLSINVRKFLASPEFRDRFVGSQPIETRTVSTGRPTTTMKYVNRGDGPGSVSDAVGGVVALITDDGHGSGFLIDESGMVITNRHVVGKEKYIKVRWPDGIETLGEVVRSDTKRDVALVKTDPRGRKPLKLATGAPGLGEDVFAIGTPLDEQFQSTVTRGIVSANRTFDGLSYIQSDVTINPGNSGGPLLDKAGRVLGVTVAGIQLDGAMRGLNLFIPIRDALDFLMLQPDAAQATARAPEGARP
jgi:S1-C subfamily serine protease